MDIPASHIPTLPNNPQIAVLRFIPSRNVRCPPAMGSMIAELFAMMWWQSPCLNMLHHWLYRFDMKFIHPMPSKVASYVERVAKHLPCDIYVAGRFRVNKSFLSMEAGVFTYKAGAQYPEIEQVVVHQEGGSIENLTAVVTSCAKKLLKKWFPPALEFLQETAKPLIDAPLDALEQLCSGLDYLAFDPPAESLCKEYVESAMRMAPRSVFLQFMAARSSSECRRTVDFCKRLLSENESFIPAYFPDYSFDAETNELRRARELYVEGLRYVPFNVHSYCGLREICTTLGDFETLLPLCRRHVLRGSFASTKSAFGDTFLTSAELACDKRQYEMSRALCEEGLNLAEDTEDQAALLAMRAYVEEDTGNFGAALEFYKKSLELFVTPSRSILYANLLCKVQYYQEAESILKHIVTQQKGVDSDTYYRANYLLGKLYAQQGRAEEARLLFTKLCKLALRSPGMYEIRMNAIRWLAEHSNKLPPG